MVSSELCQETQYGIKIVVIIGSGNVLGLIQWWHMINKILRENLNVFSIQICLLSIQVQEQI